MDSCSGLFGSNPWLSLIWSMVSVSAKATNLGFILQVFEGQLGGNERQSQKITVGVPLGKSSHF